MAEFIFRDVGSPFDPADPTQLAEFQGFGSDVPSDDGMIGAVNTVPVPVNAHSVRAARMLRPGYLAGAAALTTPDPLPADTRFERQGMRKLPVDVPGLGPVEVWSFDADMDNSIDVNLEGWPAPTIRVREGQVVHSVIRTATGPHTIHHHGIEPTSMNDGVGHLSFEVEDEYTYQWQAAESGTYFYHCHRNTTLHFEMGMYGMLIVDPAVAGAPFADGGAGSCYIGNNLASYAAEAIWVADEFDTRWHGIDRDNNGTEITDHSAGVQDNQVDAGGLPVFVDINDPDNPHMHDFRPDVFLVTGVAAPYGEDNALIAAEPGTALTPRVTRGQKILVRAVNASYCTQRWQFAAELSGQVIAADGRTFGREPLGRYASPYTLASIDHQFLLTTARRYDVLIETGGVSPGTYSVDISFHHWITDERLRTVRVQLIVD